MDELELGGPPSHGGRGAGGGGGFHLSFRSGSRGGGACAGAAYDYISREHEYDEPERDPAIYTESDHMPSWAQSDPREYWDAADLYERANGRLYVSADFALPRDLKPDEQVELARSFAHELTDDERLPYTLAVHAGRDGRGREHNPHAHLMFSERRNDGIERSREDWFRRANSHHPERGGAPKSRTFHGHDWVEHARERWADLTNATLERLDRPERVDHRSYERQGIDQEPGEHYGPSAAHVVGRGDEHDRLEAAASRADEVRAIQEVSHEIAQMETLRQILLADALADREPERRSGASGGAPPSRSRLESDDWSRGR